jgi:hypothetical protein
MFTAYTRATARRSFWCCVALAAAPTMLLADTEEEANARVNAAALMAEVGAELECGFAVTGTPRFDEAGNVWLIGFTAAGPDCDNAAAALIARGREMGAVFFRRPDKDQLKAVLADIRRTLRRGFSCPISVRGEPAIDSSGYWVVNFVGSGGDCTDATAELGRLGEGLQIRFVRTYTAQDARELLP